MDLPLFKGVGKDQISQFLEKTRIDFVNYEKGEVLSTAGSTQDIVGFVINGEIEVSHHLDNLNIEIIETRGRGSVIGAERLFGIHRNSPYMVKALSRLSLMQFSKVQYINLLESDHIYLFNYLNFLSARGQRGDEAFRSLKSNDIGSKLWLLVDILTTPGALQIEIRGNEKDVAAYCGCTQCELIEWKKSRIKGDDILYDGDSIILIKNECKV